MLLRDRLRPALVSHAHRRSPAALPRHAAVPAFRLPSGSIEPLGAASDAVRIIEARLPLAHHHGRVALGQCLDITDLARSRLAPGVVREELARAAFIDVEATGLGGGTGTLAFLVGVATLEGESLLLRQLFLADPAGEGEMLSALNEILRPCPVVVSFNGKSFDAPLLESRFILNRLRPAFAGRPHVDLLHPARRLYSRRLGSCRLASLERSVLRFDRAGDIPGWAVPRIYFDYLRHGWDGQVRHVLRHNRLDVISLVALLRALAEVAGATGPRETYNALALARWDESRGDLGRAARLYGASLRRGAPEDFHAALRGLVRVQRRLGQWEELERALRDVLAGTGRAVARLEAAGELARLLERRRDLPAAEGLLRHALSLLDVLALRSPGRSVLHKREEMERRLLRLQQRQAGARSGHAAAAEERLHL